jgi:hypothetical protein
MEKHDGDNSFAESLLANTVVLGCAGCDAKMDLISGLTAEVTSYRTVGAAAGHQIALWMTRAEKAEADLHRIAVAVLGQIEPGEACADDVIAYVERMHAERVAADEGMAKHLPVAGERIEPGEAVYLGDDGRAYRVAAEGRVPDENRTD